MLVPCTVPQYCTAAMPVNSSVNNTKSAAARSARSVLQLSLTFADMTRRMLTTGYMINEGLK